MSSRPRERRGEGGTGRCRLADHYPERRHAATGTGYRSAGRARIQVRTLRTTEPSWLGKTQVRLWRTRRPPSLLTFPTRSSRRSWGSDSITGSPCEGSAEGSGVRAAREKAGSVPSSRTVASTQRQMNTLPPGGTPDTRAERPGTRGIARVAASAVCRDLVEEGSTLRRWIAGYPTRRSPSVRR